jgi:hypothetical protein
MAIKAQETPPGNKPAEQVPPPEFGTVSDPGDIKPILILRDPPPPKLPVGDSSSQEARRVNVPMPLAPGPQDNPRPAGRIHNPALRIITWPFRAYYKETVMTFRDFRNDKGLLIEAIFLCTASAFDMATTINHSNQYPNGREVNPVMRAFIGNHPHGARPYAVMFAINVFQIDLHHYMKRTGLTETEEALATFINMSAGVVHIASGAINLNNNPCDPKKSTLCPKDQAHLH